jgi:hypothetical protein
VEVEGAVEGGGFGGGVALDGCAGVLGVEGAGELGGEASAAVAFIDGEVVEF